MLKISAHELGLIMTDAQSIDRSLLSAELLDVYNKKKKEDADKSLLEPFWNATLSVGAKTHIKKLAREYVYGFKESVSSKYMEKGLIVEDESIELYNTVFNLGCIKNTERKTNAWLTGECDIECADKVVDIKSAWSLATFPCFSEDGIDKVYEWQGRAYMMLWDKPFFENAFCMVNTPEDLIRYEPIDQHIVDHIPANLRVTIVKYTRDLELEEKIKTKVEACQEYFNECLDRIALDHNH